MKGLTSLFGMGRGEHLRQNHHKLFAVIHSLNKIILGKVVRARKATKKIKAYGQLVLLDFTVTSFTSVAYQRYRL
jgi:hypothetical protein